MHQYSVHRMILKPAILVATTVDPCGEADVVWVQTLVGELRCILKNEDRPF